MDALKNIESQMEAIGQSIRNEGQVYQAELEERQRLGLHGEAAIRHYNEWMQRHGMQHLMVKDDAQEKEPTYEDVNYCYDMMCDDDTSGIEQYLVADTMRHAKAVYKAWAEKWAEETSYVRMPENGHEIVENAATQVATMYLRERKKGASVAEAHKTASWQLRCALDRYRIKL